MVCMVDLLGHYGKFWIASIGEEDGVRTMHFEFMFQPIPNLLVLK